MSLKKLLVAIGIFVFGCLAVAGFIKPFIDSITPAIIAVGTPAEIAMWGLLPILILVLLVPAVILIRRKENG